MAIIRTQLVSGQRRIITKVVNGQRRVSCSCCETECCMYPAAEVGGSITFEDLPDTIRLNPFEGGSITGTKLAEPIDLSDSTAYYELGEVLVIIKDGLWGSAIDFSRTSETACLVEGLYSFGVVTDNFADTYTVDNSFTGGTDSRERATLCIWGGVVLGYLAYYDGTDSFIKTYYSGPSHKWVYIVQALQQDEGGGLWVKDNPQNGPAGTYSPSTNVAGNFYAGLGTVTVS